MPPVGPLRSLWRLARPRMGLWAAAAPAFGYGYGHWEFALDGVNPLGLVLLVPAWGLVHAGTLWYNACLDPGEGDVLFGEGAEPVPHLQLAAFVALAIAVVLATLASPRAGGCAAVAAALAILYSHPRTAWKSHPVLGPLVNVVGYGELSLVAGWALVEVPFTTRWGLSLTITSAWALGLYFAAQVFQEDEDRRRGHRTLVATHGAEVTRRAARAAFLVGDAVLVVLLVAGWYPRLCAVGLPALFMADRHLRHIGDEAWARGLVKLLLLAGMLSVAGACAQFILDICAGGVVAGLATAGGRPTVAP